MLRLLHYVKPSDKTEFYKSCLEACGERCKIRAMQFKMYEFRKQRGMTQEQVAERLGISVGLYNQLESGKRRMNETYIEGLAELYGVSPVNLIVDTVRDDPLFQELDALYRQLSPEERRILVRSARGIAASRD